MTSGYSNQLSYVLERECEETSCWCCFAQIALISFFRKTQYIGFYGRKRLKVYVNLPIGDPVLALHLLGRNKLYYFLLFVSQATPLLSTQRRSSALCTFLEKKVLNNNPFALALQFTCFALPFANVLCSNNSLVGSRENPFFQEQSTQEGFQKGGQNGIALILW